jgi:hypothetical protein
MGDWREQKFWWSGTLSNVKSTYHWTGAWVGSFDGKPSEEEFTESPNKFHIIGPSASLASGVEGSGVEQNMRLIGDYVSAAAAAAAAAPNRLLPPLVEAHAFAKGHYLMDNGDGTSRFKDKACNMQFMPREPYDNAVLFEVKGRVDTEFGVGYVTGLYDATTQCLCVERTYCDEDDATYLTMPGPAKKARKKKKK